MKQKKIKYTFWTGKFNKENKKNGIGKEYDIDNNLIFEGEYEDGLKKKGKEFYIIGAKKYEGDYKNGKRWNGMLYDIHKKNKYELKMGNGYIKEYHQNGALSFEGVIKDGNKNGKGKIYNECGHLLFEGEFNNGVKNGKGKIYNHSGDLIYDGEFINDKKVKGNEYKYNDKCELIYTKESEEEKIYKSLQYYENDIRIQNCIWIMKKRRNTEYIHIGREYKNGKNWNGIYYFEDNNFRIKNQENNDDDLIFENDNKNGRIYKGKEKNFGKLIFEGEYIDGEKWNGKFCGYYNKYGKSNFTGQFNYYILNGTIIDKINTYYSIDPIYFGEFKDGKKEGKGQEFNKEGKCIFIGYYKNGERYKGKEFNNDGNLIFKGEYKNGRYFNGIKIQKISSISYEYASNYYLTPNEYKILEYKNGKFSKNIDLKDDKFSLYIEYLDGNMYNGNIEIQYKNRVIATGEFKGGKIYNGKIIGCYEIYAKLIKKDYKKSFLGEYKNGKYYKGKEKGFDHIIFEGEYKNGIRWNGIFYNPRGDTGKIVEGNGTNIKEYNEYMSLIFEGDYKKGLRHKVKKKNKVEVNNDAQEMINEDKIIFEDENNQKTNDLNNAIVKGKIMNKLGEIIFKGEFKNGKKYKGLEKYYDRFGEIIFEGEYKEGNKFYGEEYYYYNKVGQIIFEGEFKNDKKYKGKEYKEYKKTKKIMFEGEYKDNERWNGKGYNNEFKFSYVDGNIEGNVVTYDYINHELFEGEYKKGEKYNGKLRTYFDDINGIIKRVVEIKNGEITGKGREYYGNKRLKYEGMYKNGKPEGNGILYFEYFGHIQYIGEFKNGMKHGQGKEYDKWGNIIYQGEFNENKKK